MPGTELLKSQVPAHLRHASDILSSTVRFPLKLVTTSGDFFHVAVYIFQMFNLKKIFSN